MKRAVHKAGVSSVPTPNMPAKKAQLIQLHPEHANAATAMGVDTYGRVCLCTEWDKQECGVGCVDVHEICDTRGV